MQVYGIDLSMESFDVEYVDANGEKKSKQVKNSLNGIGDFLDTVVEGSVMCAEYTGCYGDLLLFLCNQRRVPIALVPGYTIKHSLGMTKGKSDKMDASRIREYGERFYDKLTFKEYASEEIVELRALYSFRSQMVQATKLLKTGSHSRSKAPMQSVMANRLTQETIAAMKARIEEVDQEIVAIIRQTPELNENYDLVIGVKGVGPVIATELIIKTGNFKNIDTARKAASYAGVCPFPNESGTMVKKSKTSPFADKKLKSLLYMGAKSAVKYNKEYRLYYEKKKIQGKHHYLIMNNIANKMLRTIYSIIASRTPYSNDYICLDPRENIIINSSSKKVA